MSKKQLKTSKLKSKHKNSKKISSNESYLVVFKSWMFVVAFALMLGIGLILGSFMKQTTEQALNSPTVAGDQIIK